MRLAVLLGAVTLLPFAAACSLAGEPAPGPGHIWIYEPDGTLVLDIPVAKRGLGASCELSNLLGMSPGRMAWVAGDQVHWLVLDSLERSSMPVPVAGLSSSSTTVLDDGLLLFDSEFANGNATTTWTLVGWDGTQRAVPLPNSWAHLYWSDGAYGLVTSGPGAKKTTASLYHLASGSALTDPYASPPVAAGPGWTVEEADRAYVLRQGEDELGRIGWSGVESFDREGVWLRTLGSTSQLERRSWTGETLEAFAPSGRFMAATPTHVVTAAFWASGAPSPTGDAEIPGPALALIGLAAACAAGWKRRA
ncbi:MAG: hypothetical protein AABY18_01355 [Candidatus Thermoplasmatota archaeon]